MDNSALQRVLDYRHQATECEMLAAKTHDLESREILMSVAARWRALADDKRAPRVAKQLRPKAPYPSGGW